MKAYPTDCNTYETTMRIQFLNGGLANQVFQYIFYRAAALHHPDETWFLDDSFFFVHRIHNGYELERVFGLRPALLSRFFDADVWDYMIRLKRDENLSIPEILRRNGESIRMISEMDNWSQWNPFDGSVSSIPANGFDPDIMEAPGDIVYYHGYWINREWFRMSEETLRRELVFPALTVPKDLETAQWISSCPSCSVHIRRGDYATLGLTLPNDVFRTMIRNMLEAVPDLTLFVFSDDPAYCRDHADTLGLTLPRDTVYISGNSGQNAFRDMQLMSMCRNMILSNSAFCYLAALLNPALQNVVNPTDRKL